MGFFVSTFGRNEKTSDSVTPRSRLHTKEEENCKFIFKYSPPLNLFFASNHEYQILV